MKDPDQYWPETNTGGLWNRTRYSFDDPQVHPSRGPDAVWNSRCSGIGEFGGGLIHDPAGALHSDTGTTRLNLGGTDCTITHGLDVRDRMSGF